MGNTSPVQRDLERRLDAFTREIFGPWHREFASLQRLIDRDRSVSTKKPTKKPKKTEKTH